MALKHPASLRLALGAALCFSLCGAFQSLVTSCESSLLLECVTAWEMITIIGYSSRELPRGNRDRLVQGKSRCWRGKRGTGEV